MHNSGRSRRWRTGTGLQKCSAPSDKPFVRNIRYAYRFIGIWLYFWPWFFCQQAPISRALATFFQKESFCRSFDCLHIILVSFSFFWHKDYRLNMGRDTCWLMSQYRNISPYFEPIFDCSRKHIYRHILPLFNPQPKPFSLSGTYRFFLVATIYKQHLSRHCLKPGLAF